MAVYDPQKAARVWNRVQAAPQPMPLEAQLQGLVMEENRAAAVYFRLSRQMKSREASVLQQLGREEQTHASCLKGIYTLITGQRLALKTPVQEAGNPEAILRQCYAGEMRSLKEYESRMDDPQYGAVFARLADQERDHCRTLLELIGSLHHDRN